MSDFYKKKTSSTKTQKHHKFINAFHELSGRMQFMNSWAMKEVYNLSGSGEQL